MQQNDPKKSTKKVSFKWAFKNVIWPRRKYIFIGLFLIVISRLAGLVLPMSLSFLIDTIIPEKLTQELYLLLIFVSSAILVQAITSFLLTKILSIEAQHLIAKLRVQIQKKILSLPSHYFDNNKSGAIVSRIMTDVEGVRNLVGTGLVQLIGGSITAVITLILLLKMNVYMTLFTLIPVSIFAVIALKAFAFIRPIFQKRRKLNAQVSGRLTETIGGIRVIKGFNAEKQESKTFEDGVENLFKNVKKSMTSTALVTSSSTFLMGLASAGIMGIGGYFMMQDQMTKGEFVEFTVLLGFMVAPIVQMSNIGSQITDALSGLDRMQEIMDMEEENNTNERTSRIHELKGDITFDNVSFAYEKEKEVLHHISFEAPEGSITALVGSSGSGKSTITSLVSSFMTPSSGLITVDGQDLSKVNLDDFRQHLGVVLQEDFLFEGTIRENILFPKPDASEEEIQQAIEASYVNEFTDRFDDGLDTVIGERGIKLSGGQRQRISIARALLVNPKILILDEATSSLDTESETFIQKSLEKLIQNRTTFIIAHRLSTIRQADQILVIEEGRIVEQGKHDELIDKKGRYYNLFTYQSKI